MEEAPWASWTAKLLTFSLKRLLRVLLMVHTQIQMILANVKDKAQFERHKTVDFLTDNLINSIQEDKNDDLEIKV